MADPQVSLPAGYQLDVTPQLPAGYALDKPIAVNPDAVRSAGAPPDTTGPMVRPGASDDEIIRSFGYDPALIKASPRYQAAVKSHGSGVSWMLTNPNRKDLAMQIANSPAGDLGEGGLDIARGLVQLARHGAGKLGMLSDADVQYGDLLDRVANQDYLQNIRQGKASGAMRMLGNFLVPVPGGSLVKGEGLAAAVGRGALEGSAAGAMQPVTTGSPDNYWSNKAGQVGVGAGTGAAIGAAAGVGSKVVNAARGSLPQEAADLMEQGQQHGVRLTYGDITGKPMAQRAEVAMEQVPVVGTAGVRAAQQTEAKAAAQKVEQGLYERFVDTDPEAFQDVTDAAQKGDPRARNLIDKLQNAGNDPDRVLQASIGLADFRTRQTATDLYDKVEELVEKNGLGDVPLPGTKTALRSALDELKAAKLPNKEVQGLLEQIRSSISPKAAPMTTPPTNIQDYRTWAQNQATTTPANNGYGAMRQLLSDLGDRIRTYYEGNNAIIGEKGVGYLERVRNAIEGDMSDFTTKSGVPEVAQAGQTADEYYKTARVPFKDGQLASAAVTTEPDQIFQQFIKAGKGDRAQKFYEALDAKGKASVRYQMVAKAVNDATNPTTRTFSPQRFFSSMDKIDDAYSVFFRGTDKWQMDGFRNLMAHITRAGQFAENPPTGQRVIPFLIGGATAAAAKVNPALAAEVGATVAAAKALMTTPAGTRFLLAASRLKPGSQAMQSLVDSMGAKLATAPSAAEGASAPAQQ